MRSVATEIGIKRVRSSAVLKTGLHSDANASGGVVCCNFAVHAAKCSRAVLGRRAPHQRGAPPV